MTEWIKIFALALQLFSKTDGAPNTSLVIQWDNLSRAGLTAPEGKQALFVSLVAEAGRQEICSYVFIPWQNIYENHAGNDSIGMLLYDIYTVNEFAVIYRSERAVSPMYKEAAGKLDRFVQFFTKQTNNQKTISEQDGFSSPDSVRYISFKEYPYYTRCEIATTGSNPVSGNNKVSAPAGKMRYQILIPDQGQVKSSWIYSGPAITDPCFVNNENRFLDIFTRNMKHCLVDINQKENLYTIALDEITAVTAECSNGKQTEEQMTDLFRRLLNKKSREDAGSASDFFADYQPARVVTPASAQEEAP